MGVCLSSIPAGTPCSAKQAHFHTEGVNWGKKIVIFDDTFGGGPM